MGAAELRRSGYLARAVDERIVISLSDRMFQLLNSFGIQNLSSYRPADLSESEWVEHEGKVVATFPSIYSFFSSQWMERFFLGPKPLGEGVVLASWHDGKMLKVKHGGECVGAIPT